MITIYQHIIPANSVYTSDSVYSGTIQGSGISLITNPTQCIFINGATAQVTVTLQAACVPTPLNQQSVNLPPANSEYVTDTVYNANTIDTKPSRASLWQRFQINNTSSSDAIITCQLA